MGYSLRIIALILATALVAGFFTGYLSTRRVEYLVVSPAHVRELVSSIAVNISAIRGLRFRELPDVILINSSEVIATLGWEVPEDVLVLGDILVLTLLADLGYNVSTSYTKLLGMWMAASAGSTIYVVYDVLDLNDPITYRVLAHELTHVLQGQHFSLPNPTTLDGVLAIRSLVEGDADLVADAYVEALGLSGIPKVSELPLYDPYLAVQLVPYVFGKRFAEYIVSLGGWELLNSVYVNPPRSMKYVMFPNTYLLGEPLAEVGIAIDKVCDRLRIDSLGPAYVYILVSRYSDASKALSIAGGWVGDRLVYCAYGDAREVRWAVKFNSSAVAGEFYALLNSIAVLRGGVGCGEEWYVNGLVASLRVEGDVVTLLSRMAPKGAQYR